MPARLASPLLQFTKAARISGSVSGFTTDEASPRPDHQPNSITPGGGLSSPQPGPGGLADAACLPQRYAGAVGGQLVAGKGDLPASGEELPGARAHGASGGRVGDDAGPGG